MSGSSQDTDKNCPEQEFDEENRILAQVPVFEEPAKEHLTVSNISSARDVKPPVPLCQPVSKRNPPENSELFSPSPVLLPTNGLPLNSLGTGVKSVATDGKKIKVYLRFQRCAFPECVDPNTLPEAWVELVPRK